MVDDDDCVPSMLEVPAVHDKEQESAAFDHQAVSYFCTKYNGNQSTFKVRPKHELSASMIKASLMGEVKKPIVIEVKIHISVKLSFHVIITILQGHML